MENNQQQNGDMEKLSTLNAQFINNFIANDVTHHNEIIHKDFIYISSSGKIVSRDEYMKAWAHGWDDKIDKTFEYNSEVIRIFGNTALVRSNTFFQELKTGKLSMGKLYIRILT